MTKMMRYLEVMEGEILSWKFVKVWCLRKEKTGRKKKLDQETFISQKKSQRPKSLPFIPKKNQLLFNSGPVIPSPSISIPSTPSSDVFRILTPPPDAHYSPEEYNSFLKSIKGQVGKQHKFYDSFGSSCDTLDEVKNGSKDGLHSLGKVMERKKMWETKINEFQRQNEKSRLRNRFSNKRNERLSKSEHEKCFTSDDELDTLREYSRRVSRSGSLKYILHNTTDGNIYIETTDDEMIKSYVGEDTPPSSIEYSLNDHLQERPPRDFTKFINIENGPIPPARKKKKHQKGRKEDTRSRPQYSLEDNEDLATMLTSSLLSQKQLVKASDLRCYLVYSALKHKKTRSMSLPDITAIIPSNLEDTFETGETYNEYKKKFAYAKKFFEIASLNSAPRESDINSECADICNRYRPYQHKKVHDYHSDDGFERYFYVEKKNYLDIDCSTERSSSRNSIDHSVQTEKGFLSRDKGCQSSAESTPTHCPSCRHDLELKSRPRKRRSTHTYDLIELPKIKRKILKRKRKQLANYYTKSLPSSDIECFETDILTKKLEALKPWDVNPVDGNPWLKQLGRQHSLPDRENEMRIQTNKFSDEETKQHSLPYGGLGIRKQSDIYSDGNDSSSMRLKPYGRFGLRNSLPLVASLKDLSRNLPSPYPDAPQDILDDLDHSVFQNVPKGQVIHTLGGLYNKEYPHIPIRQFRRGTHQRQSKHQDNLIAHKDLRRSSLNSEPESWARNKRVHPLGLFSDCSADDNFTLENDSIVSSRTTQSPVPLPRTNLSLGVENYHNIPLFCDENRHKTIANSYYNDEIIKNDTSISEAEFIARNVGELKERLDSEIKSQSCNYAIEARDPRSVVHRMEYSEPSCPSSSDEGELDQRFQNIPQWESHSNGRILQSSMRISQDVAACRAYGLGLEWGKVDRVNTFTIDTNGATSGEVTVSVDGPHEGSVSRTEVYPVDETAGLYQVHYTVTTPATYLIAITWAQQHILGSPFTCDVGD